MKIIVGLGNPGIKYKSTPHNVGFMVVEALAKNINLKFSVKPKLRAEIAKGRLGKNELIIAKPTTYMNLSGEAVVNLINFYKVSPPDIWLVYDDVDIEFGYIKIKPFGSAAGHKGINSVIQALGTEKFPRFRIGIKLSYEESKKANYSKLSTARFVTRPFIASQKTTLNEIIKQTAEAIKLALTKGLPAAMNKYN